MQGKVHVCSERRRLTRGSSVVTEYQATFDAGFPDTGVSPTVNGERENAPIDLSGTMREVVNDEVGLSEVAMTCTPARCAAIT